MTRFFINDREIEPPLDASSLSQILKHVETTYLPPNSVVRRVQIDGLPLMPGDYAENMCQLLEQIEKRDKVEIFTGTLTEIARDSISEALVYLDRVETAIPSLAESFRVSSNSECFENLKQLCQGFYWLNLLLDKLQMNFQLYLKDTIINGVSVPEYHQKFISILTQLIKSQEAGDCFLISDLLEYEILPLTPVWRGMLVAISTQMRVTQ